MSYAKRMSEYPATLGYDPTDAELDAAIAARDAIRAATVVEQRTNLRGVGVVTPPSKVKVHRPNHVRRSDGYIARNGAWIATAEAGYLELSKDVRTRTRARKTPQYVKNAAGYVVPVGAAQSYEQRVAQQGAIGNVE